MRFYCLTDVVMAAKPELDTGLSRLIWLSDVSEEVPSKDGVPILLRDTAETFQ